MKLCCTVFCSQASDVMCTAMEPLVLHGCKGVDYRIAKKYEHVFLVYHWNWTQIWYSICRLSWASILTINLWCIYIVIQQKHMNRLQCTKELKNIYINVCSTKTVKWPGKGKRIFWKKQCWERMFVGGCPRMQISDCGHWRKKNLRGKGKGLMNVPLLQSIRESELHYNFWCCPLQ